MSEVPVQISCPQQDAQTLLALRRRTLVLVALLVPAIALTILLVMTRPRSMRNADLAERAIPMFFSTPERTWTATAMKFSELELAVLETRDYVYRTYTDGRGPPVDLCVVFSEDNRKGTHPPDVCLEASSIRIMSRQDRQVRVGESLVPLRELVTIGPGSGGGAYLYFAYFYKCGDVFTPSFYKQQVQIVWNGLARRDASGALIRFSTPMASSTDLDSARSRVDALLAVTFPPIRDQLGAAQ